MPYRRLLTSHPPAAQGRGCSGTKCYASRSCSQQEQLYLTCGLRLRGSSRQVESLCVASPQNRPTLLNTAALQAATSAIRHNDEPTSDDEADGDEAEAEARGHRAATLQLNKFDFYKHRPEELDSCTLAQFVRSALHSVESSLSFTCCSRPCNSQLL